MCNHSTNGKENIYRMIVEITRTWVLREKIEMDMHAFNLVCDILKFILVRLDELQCDTKDNKSLLIYLC